jgi:hypothetical protein
MKGSPAVGTMAAGNFAGLRHAPLAAQCEYYAPAAPSGKGLRGNAYKTRLALSGNQRSGQR